MRSVARLAAVGSAFAFVACATLAGLDDPTAEGDTTSGSTSSSGSLQDTGNGSSGATSSGGSSSGTPAGDSSSSDGASSSGAPMDAQPDVPACVLLPNGDTCNQPSQCCSNKCNEQRKCASDCKNEGSFNCTPTSTNECCIGLFCSSVGGCAPCITSGQPAAVTAVGSFPMPQSCCSRQLQGGTGPNCQ